MSNLINSYIIYQVIKKLTMPFSNWKACKLGVIDENGNILIEPKDRTQEEKNSFSLLDVFILNMKKILMKLPGGNTKFATYAGALFLLKEEEITEEKFLKFLNENNDLTAGAGLEGTYEVVKNYMDITPGQGKNAKKQKQTKCN